MSPSSPPSQSSLAAGAPEASVVIACYNAQDFLEKAVQSAFAQRGVEVEVIVIDDHSTDQSYALAQRLAARDARVRVLQTPSNCGPGGARNVGIAAMRGEWYCVLDCDDLMLPDRLRTLIDAAKMTNADLIADDLIVFGDDHEEHRHCETISGTPPRTLSLEDYFEATQMFGTKPNLGFLKPLIHRRVLVEAGHRYREDLQIGEDDELMVQLLLAGFRYVVTSDALYRYRKHDASISHRLSAKNSERMLSSEEHVRACVSAADRESAAYRARFASIQDAVAFSRAVEALKERRWTAAISEMSRRPLSVRHFSMPIASQWNRLRARLGSS
ncbi:MAG: glycosyltransferase family 2 protein [Pseudomonadota bacterium]